MSNRRTIGTFHAASLGSSQWSRVRLSRPTLLDSSKSSRAFASVQDLERDQDVADLSASLRYQGKPTDAVAHRSGESAGSQRGTIFRGGLFAAASPSGTIGAGVTTPNRMAGNVRSIMAGGLWRRSGFSQPPPALPASALERDPSCRRPGSVDVLLPTVPWRKKSCERLLREFAAQTRVPDRIHLLLDGYPDSLATPEIPQELSVHIYRYNESQGAGNRWRVAERLAAPPEFIVNFDDDMVIPPDYIDQALAKVKLPVVLLAQEAMIAAVTSLRVIMGFRFLIN